MSNGTRSGSLARADVVAERTAMRDDDHMGPLTRFAARLRLRYETVPEFDPADGGTRARLLLLLETPGPGTAPLRFVSRDNPTGTAANIRRFFDAAGIDRRASVIWNAVPQVIHASGARNRAPTRAETAAGLADLPSLLDLLPHLAVVVLAGRAAAGARPIIAATRPHLALLEMPHPSPTLVCTSPLIGARIAETLEQAALAVSGRSEGLAPIG